MFHAFDLERDELAMRLGGGLPQSAIILIEGPSGAGKSVVSQRIAYGLLTNDSNVVYVSTGFTTPSFLDQMSQLAYPVMDHFAASKLKFVPTTPLLGHPVAKRDLLPRLMGARKLLREPVVVVDDFSTIVAPHLGSGEKAGRVLEHIVRTLKQITATGTTLILTIDPDTLKRVDSSALTSAADVRLECAVQRSGGIVDRFVIAKKFARAKGMVGDVIPFRVEPGAGFIVEIKAVS